MALLGLDIGEKRIGVAISEGVLARPLTVIVRRSKEEDYQAVARLVTQYGVKCIVIGLPTTLEGGLSAQAEVIRQYARDLARVVPVPIVFVDESYSTVDAMDLMVAAGRSRKRRREALDAAAAAIILQSYLDHGAMERDANAGSRDEVGHEREMESY